MFNTSLTVICNPADPILESATLDKIDAALTPIVGEVARTTLAPKIAEDFLFASDQNIKSLQDAMAGQFSDLPVDVVIQPIAARKKRLLIADMDSTIIEQECIDELADFVGKRDEISEITERAMRGELDFEAALTERVAMLKGLPVEKMQQAFDDRITLTPGARQLVQTMRAQGAFTALVSGGFTFFTERVAQSVGFHINKANTLPIHDDHLTGNVGTPILGRTAKEEALRNFVEEQDIPLVQTLAVGDGANDLSMLGAAGLGVAFRAKPAVANAADASINHGDLTALLYLQGIPQSAFETDQ